MLMEKLIFSMNDNEKIKKKSFTESYKVQTRKKLNKFKR